MSTVTDLVPSVSIDALLLKRDAMVERVTQAHALMGEVHELALAMFEGQSTYRLELLTAGKRRGFETSQGLEELVKEIDARAWAYLLDKSGLRSFMDAKARAEWDKAISDADVPALTHATIEATFSAMHDARGEMFERGVVAVFRGLSWDYKTNQPQMFGKRLVLRYVIDRWGMYGSGRGTDRLDDLLRVMVVLDGKPEPDHRSGASRRLADAKWPHEVKDCDIDGYFSVRGFKNGNAHLTFGRQDLVDKLNRILARHYPGALPFSRDAEV